MEIFIFTVNGYSFPFDHRHGSWCIIDTHVIADCLGGNRNEIVKVFEDNQSTAKWLWRRLKVSSIYRHAFNITKVELNEKLIFHSSSSKVTSLPGMNSSDSDENAVVEIRAYTILIF